MSADPDDDFLITPGGRKYRRIRYGSEADERKNPPPRRPNCYDCNSQLGEYHIWGCGMERCPKCKGQLFSCSCDFQGDTDDEEAS